MEKLLNKLFESREVTHAIHLKTDSYSQHIALDEYYTNIIDLIDELAEVYQGQYNKVGDYMDMESKPDMSDIVKYLESVTKYVKDKRKELINEDNGHLISIFDNITVLQYRTLYKLKNLK